MLGHLQTIYPTLFRKVNLQYERERITTPDNDFLDLDWVKQGSTPARQGTSVRKKKIVVISHGLEGNTQRAYIKGMAKAFYDSGFDALAWNYRGCSEEMNKTLRFYHSGATDDLATVVDHVVALGYESVFLIGFSLGGNLTLKYAGERALSKPIKGVVTFSVPLDLYKSSLKISKPSNWIYSNRFLRSLKKKIKLKAKRMPSLNIEGIDKINDLKIFDDRYTAPLHGFVDALEYYSKCSAIHFIEKIKIPTLVVNALNDPFLSEECFPRKIINPFVTLEYPERGGHVGFARFGRNGLYWSEQRALDFIKEIAND